MSTHLHSTLLVLLVTMVLGLGLGLAPPSRGGVLAPLAGSGDFSFTADLPVFPGDRGPRLDLAVQVYNPELHFEGSPSYPQMAVVEMSVKIARHGVIAHEVTDYYQLRAPAEQTLSSLHYQLLERSFALEPGRWAVTIRLRDVGRERSQLVANLDQVVAEASGVLEVPEPPAVGPRWSDPEFRTREGLPNPERLFGVNEDTLLAYLELADAEPKRTYTMGLEVIDPIGGGVEKETVVLTPERPRAGAMVQVPLGTFPEGTYRIRWLPGWDETVERETEFSVSWRMDRAVQSARDLWVEAVLMLPSGEIDRFRRLSRPAQLEVMDRFWASVDPTPHTTQNEIYERFRRRAQYAQQHYGRYDTPGPLTDRGRIYVRYGPPALISLEVVPLNAEQLDEAIERVHDTYQMEQPGQFTKESIIRQPLRLLELSETQEESADRRRNLLGAGREGAFELWQYNLQGEPLVGENLTWSENVDMRFLFVDRMGSGDYRLEYTNMPLQY